MGSFGFLIDLIFGQHFGPGVESASNLDEYQEYLRGVKATDAWGLTLPLSCADCLEILAAYISWDTLGLS